MAKELQTVQGKDEMKRDERAALENLIREQVMQALGKPVDLQNVQVRKVSNDNYRVNVIVGANAACARVANSYFIKIDSDGALIAATPKITKQY